MRRAFGKNMIKNGINQIEKYLVTEGMSVKDAMVKMDKNGEKVVFVVDEENRLKGSVTDGDIRRWILASGSLHDKLLNLYNKSPRYMRVGCDIRKIKQLMLRDKIEWVPIIKNGGQIANVLVWEDVFAGQEKAAKKRINVPVVIMAGGVGSRLEPFTEILPKPLVPIQGKPIITIILNKFREYGVNEFFISLNYKSKIIKAYFEEIDIDCNINYLIEHKPLGTAGCLKMIAEKKSGPIVVTNCDIIIESDYSEIIEFHKRNGNNITIVGSHRHFVIPYGICGIGKNGILDEIREKPSYDYFVNTGMYVLDSKVLNLIPNGKIFHMTDLIKKSKELGGKIMVFPISEKSWIDVGQWDEYHRALKRFKSV